MVVFICSMGGLFVFSLSLLWRSGSKLGSLRTRSMKYFFGLCTFGRGRLGGLGYDNDITYHSPDD